MTALALTAPPGTRPHPTHPTAQSVTRHAARHATRPATPIRPRLARRAVAISLTGMILALGVVCVGLAGTEAGQHVEGRGVPARAEPSAGTVRSSAAVPVTVSLAAAGAAAVAVPVAPAPPSASAAPGPPRAVRPAPPPPPVRTPGTSPTRPTPAPPIPAAPSPSPPPPAIPDPGYGSGIEGMIARGLSGLLTVLLTQSMKWVLEPVGSALLSTPRLDTLPMITRGWDTSWALVLASYVMLVMIGGIIVMGHETVQTSYSAREIAPRLVWGFLASALSLWAAGQVIDLANALSLGLWFDAATPAQLAATLTQAITPQMGGMPLLLNLLALGVLVLLIALLITWVMRLVITALLLVLAPLTQMCWALPGTEHIARWWWRAFVSVLGVQVAQSLVLVLGLRLLLDPDGITTLGVPTPTALLRLVMVLTLLCLAVKIPFWAWSSLKPGHGRSFAGSLVRGFIAYKTLGLLGGIGRSGARAGAGARAARAGGAASRGGSGSTGPGGPGPAGAGAVMRGLARQQHAQARQRPRRASGVGAATFLPPPGSEPARYSQPGPPRGRRGPAHFHAPAAPSASPGVAPTLGRPAAGPGPARFRPPTPPPTVPGVPRPAGPPPTPTWSAIPTAHTPSATAATPHARRTVTPPPVTFSSPAPHTPTGATVYTVPAHPVVFSNPTATPPAHHRAHQLGPQFPHPPPATPPRPTTTVGTPRRRRRASRAGGPPTPRTTRTPTRLADNHSGDEHP